MAKLKAPQSRKLSFIERIHQAAMVGINSREELFEELQRIQEKTSRKTFQQRAYLFWYGIELLQREQAAKEAAAASETSETSEEE